MDREIKFRVWDEQSQKMRAVHALSFDDYLSVYAESLGDSDGDSVCLAHSYQLMQLTGLYDEDGKEIYEGDVVEVQLKWETKTPHRSVVWFNARGIVIDGHPAHRSIGVGQQRFLYDYARGDDGRVCRVLGNVFENPELVEDQA